LSIVEGFRHPAITIITEPDSGMYEALAKGLRRAEGKVVAYLNAGDLYHPHAFDVVLDLFETGRVSWLTGYNVIYSSSGVMTYALLPPRYRTSLFVCGLYGTLLPYVQQECTFWAAELTPFLDLERLASLRLAGDYYLWSTFCHRAPLTIVTAVLGGFRRHSGQLSLDREGYRREVRTMTRCPGPFALLTALLDGLVWYGTPPAVKKWLNPHGILSYDHVGQRWR
jgi:hypothetical protein